MSVRLMSMVFDAHFEDIEYTSNNETKKLSGSTAKFVLLALADHANDDGEGAYPSINRLANKTDLSHRTILNALSALKQARLIEYQGVSSRGTSNYTINKSVLDEHERSMDRESSSLEVGNPVPQGRESSSPESSFNHPLTINIPEQKTKKSLTSEDYKKMTEETLFKGLTRQIGKEDNRVNEYPEDVRPILTAVCELFHLKCPSIKSTHSGQWIKESRELRDACGEFEKQVLVDIAEEFEQHKRLKGGTVPFPITGPHSLVNTARGKAGLLRSQVNVSNSLNNISKGARIMYIGGKAYSNGVEVEG